MKKKVYLLLLAVSLFTTRSFAQLQPCGQYDATQGLYAQFPEIKKFVEEYNNQIKEGLKNIDYKVAHKTTDSAASDTPFWYDIPIVIHVVHDYGPENLSDDFLFNALKDWNLVYAGANPDTSTVIAPFKKWIGIPRIRLHLATKDPLGNPTKGITRHRSYLTNIGGDQSKLGDWPRASYVNIWTIKVMNAANGNAAAYAYTPDGASGAPMYDGIISLYDYFANDYSGPYAISKTVNHEMGHVLNLKHPFGDVNNAPNPDCGDDEVDDTPPTKGHMGNGCAKTAKVLYDTTCVTGYFKIYHSDFTGYDSLVDYPDTVNAQNIMDYTYCSRMFTKGQVERMHACLNNTLSDRNNLWAPFNLAITGALAPVPDLKPICEYSAVSNSTVYDGPKYFTAPFEIYPTLSHRGNTFCLFKDMSWNDTISTVHWQFSAGAKVTDTITKGKGWVYNFFSQPGWVSLTMTTTDTSGGGSRPYNTTTTSFSNAIFVADAVSTNPVNYYQEFTPGGDCAKWPFFNYYNNEFKWQLDTTVGFYDHYCMKYVGYDSRLDPRMGAFPYTGAPSGDFDDLYTVPFDLSGFDTSSHCYLNYYYSGASRSSSALDINDSMEVEYSIDSSYSWHILQTMTRRTLQNMGSLAKPYEPASQQDWASMSIPLPLKMGNDTFRAKYVLFRFRYFPENGSYKISSGNNFYLDRINISNYPASVSNVKTNNLDVVIAPNPTSGNAYVIVNGSNANSATVTVTDIAGKTVYTTTQDLIGTDTKIEIPQNVIAVRGIYLVQTVTGKIVNNQKLVVY